MNKMNEEELKGLIPLWEKDMRNEAVPTMFLFAMRNSMIDYTYLPLSAIGDGMKGHDRIRYGIDLEIEDIEFENSKGDVFQEVSRIEIDILAYGCIKENEFTKDHIDCLRRIKEATTKQERLAIGDSMILPYKKVAFKAQTDGFVRRNGETEWKHYKGGSCNPNELGYYYKEGNNIFDLQDELSAYLACTVKDMGLKMKTEIAPF